MHSHLHLAVVHVSAHQVRACCCAQGEGNAQSALLREIEAAGRTRTKYEASAEQVSDYRSRLSIEVARVSEGPSVNDELTASLRVIQHYPFHAAIQEASWSAVWCARMTFAWHNCFGSGSYQGLNRAIIARLKTSAVGSPSLSPQLGAGLLESAVGALQRNISPSTMQCLLSPPRGPAL